MLKFTSESILRADLMTVKAPGWFLCAPPWKSEISPGLWAIGLKRNKNPQNPYTECIVAISEVKKWLADIDRKGEKKFYKKLIN